MSRLTAASHANAGFTLFEVLVALAIVAMSLSSIAMLIATTVRGARSIEPHLTRLQTVREIATALPDRDQLVPGQFSGETAGHHWRIDVSPFPSSNMPGGFVSPWVPQLVMVMVQPPSGAPIEIGTVRLRRRIAQ